MTNIFQNISSNLLLIQAFCCFSLTGLIWVVQLVHYPSFAFVEPSQFQAFTKFHGARISIIVLPLMCLELLTAFLLMYGQLEVPQFSKLFIINFFGVLLIWASTFLLSVPIHAKLESGFDLNQIKFLVMTNWPRTIFWSLRSMLLLWVLGFRFS